MAKAADVLPAKSLFPLWPQLIAVAPDAQFALGVVPQEFRERRSMRIMATVARHDLARPRIHDIFSQRMIDVFPVGVAGEAHFTLGCRYFPADRRGQMGVVANRAILVIDQGVVVLGQFVGGGLVLVTGPTDIRLPAGEQWRLRSGVR